MTDRVAGSVAERLRRHAAVLERNGRSPLSVAIMRGAAGDLDADPKGPVGAVFDGVPAPPGSVPGLRLLAALHHLVLTGAADELARHYPSAGGTAPPAEAWPAARRALAAETDAVRARIGRTVQTNEPGRATALYGALLCLAERHARPIRLLEIGASGGLNLRADRFAYVVGGTVLGDPASPLVFDEPWTGVPVADPAAAAAGLRIAGRAGCDPAPIDLATPAGRLALESYVWPDEPERLARQRAALEVAAAHPVRLDRADTGPWLSEHLATDDGSLTVVWQSVVRQYVPAAAWAAVEAAINGALDAGRPVAWVSFEPGDDHIAGFALRCREAGGERLLAVCGDHGPPVRWCAEQD